MYRTKLNISFHIYHAQYLYLCVIVWESAAFPKIGRHDVCVFKDKKSNYLNNILEPMLTIKKHSP